MYIVHMPKPEVGHYLLVVARQCLGRLAEPRRVKQRTSEMAANHFYEEVLCRFGTSESVVVEGGAENKR